MTFLSLERVNLPVTDWPTLSTSYISHTSSLSSNDFEIPLLAWSAMRKWPIWFVLIPRARCVKKSSVSTFCSCVPPFKRYIPRYMAWFRCSSGSINWTPIARNLWWLGSVTPLSISCQNRLTSEYSSMSCPRILHSLRKHSNSALTYLRRPCLLWQGTVSLSPPRFIEHLTHDPELVIIKHTFWDTLFVINIHSPHLGQEARIFQDYHDLHSRRAFAKTTILWTVWAGRTSVPGTKICQK